MDCFIWHHANPAIAAQAKQCSEESGKVVKGQASSISPTVPLHTPFDRPTSY